MNSKYNETIKFIDKLKKIANKAIAKENFEKALASISSCGMVLYNFNQFYADDDLEEMLKTISEKLKANYNFNETIEADNYVLFYDGFGMDLRGVALMYLSALKKNGYKIIYVTNKDSLQKQENIKNAMIDAEIIWKYIDMKKGYLNWIDSLFRIMLQYRPSTLFLYTTPYDVSGIVAFCLYEGLGDRFLIDLTDHAFWLGKCGLDYCLGSREMSASIEYYHRRINKNKLIKIGVNLLIENYESHPNLPFDLENTRYIFSGGALYKTLGDNNNTYYKIVDHILKNNQDIKFIYAGSGDDSQLKILVNKYQDRIFHIPERKDFYYFIENCVFYLNTYPMFGGMMMKYSAYAKKLPITLKHNNDADGLLINQTSARIEYETYEELISDADRLLADEKYLKERENLLEGTVVTEDRFVKNLRDAIENHKTDYQHSFIKLDTTKFQTEFLERFDLAKEKKNLVNRMNKSLFISCPWMIPIAIKKFIVKCVKIER